MGACSRPPISACCRHGRGPQSLGIRAARARAEREVLQLALAQAGSNLSKAAKLLGISRPTLYDLMQQHQIGLDAKRHLRKEGKAMPQGKGRLSWRRMAFAAALSALACQAAYAKDSAASVKEAEQYVAKGNLKAAEIELRNAIREAPQDRPLHARLADDIPAARRAALGRAGGARRP